MNTTENIVMKFTITVNSKRYCLQNLPDYFGNDCFLNLEQKSQLPHYVWSLQFISAIGISMGHSVGQSTGKLKPPSTQVLSLSYSLYIKSPEFGKTLEIRIIYIFFHFWLYTILHKFKKKCISTQLVIFSVKNDFCFPHPLKMDLEIKKILLLNFSSTITSRGDIIKTPFLEWLPVKSCPVLAQFSSRSNLRSTFCFLK